MTFQRDAQRRFEEEFHEMLDTLREIAGEPTPRRCEVSAMRERARAFLGRYCPSAVTFDQEVSFLAAELEAVERETLEKAAGECRRLARSYPSDRGYAERVRGMEIAGECILALATGTGTGTGTGR